MVCLITMKYGNYSNANVVENVIRYVTRTRINENRANELFSYGGVGVGMSLSPEEIILQFLYVQNNHRIEQRKGRRIYHEVFSLDDRDFESIDKNFYILDCIAKKCCMEYYLRGFQAVYAIHMDEKKKQHIHFVVNTISFLDGRKWHTNMRDNRERENKFNDILRHYVYQLHPCDISKVPCDFLEDLAGFESGLV